MHMYTYMCIHMIYIYIHVDMYIYIYLFDMYIYIRTYIYICMYIEGPHGDLTGMMVCFGKSSSNHLISGY